MPFSVLHSLLFYMFLLTVNKPLTHETVSQGLLLESLHKYISTYTVLSVQWWFLEPDSIDGDLELCHQPHSNKDPLTGSMYRLESS